MGWYANAWLRAYDVTGDKAFLTEAQAIFSDMTKAWDNTCGGGIYWTSERNYKNAITNELFLLVAARLARRVPNGTGPGSYHDWALKETDWFVNKSGMINGQKLINDGLTPSTCKNNNQATWSYNQGVILGGLTEMWRLTGDRGYLANAEQIADAVITRMTYPNGTLRDVAMTGAAVAPAMRSSSRACSCKAWPGSTTPTVPTSRSTAPSSIPRRRHVGPQPHRRERPRREVGRPRQHDRPVFTSRRRPALLGRGLAQRRRGVFGLISD